MASSEPIFAITCPEDPSKIMQFECAGNLKLDQSEGKGVFYCEDEEEAECESGKKEVGKFDCKGRVSGSQDGDNYSAKCDGKEVNLPELHSCQNFDVSCLNGKCKVCCDNVASATCPTGTTTFYKGKCNDQKISACNELGCSFTCDGKTVKIPDTSIKSLEKTCINGECVICGKNIRPEKPTCVHGRELFSGVCEKIIGGCREGKCSVLCDMRVAAKGSTELNFSCLDKNCVVCG
jgi:hypothetical protein